MKKVTWQDYDVAIKMMSRKIVNLQEFTEYSESKIHIIGIYRGSLGIASHLSNLHDLPMSIGKFQKYDGDDKEFEMIYYHPSLIEDIVYNEDRIVIVDDLIDTGETMKNAAKFFENLGYHNTITMTMYGPQRGNNYSCFVKNDDWLEFPWERKGES